MPWRGEAWSGAGAGCVAAVCALAVVGCAREEPPPGTPPDFRPPVVREVVPEPGSIVPGFKGSLRLRFDEPIADTRGIVRQIQGSPAYRYKFTQRRAGIDVRPDDGWRPGVVYRFRIPAGIRDLLSNPTIRPIDLVLSTGPPITETRGEGVLRNRVTDRPVLGGRILFLRPAADSGVYMGDSIPYTAVSDTGGHFSLRSLPPGEYRVYGFQDLNSNLRLDRALEPNDSARMTLAGETSVATVHLWLVEPDSTPPILVTASVPADTLVEFEFDEPLDPGQPMDSVEVAVSSVATGRAVETGRLRIGAVAERAPAFGAQAAPRRLAFAPDTTAPAGADTLARPVPEPLLPPAPDTAAGRPGGGPPARQLPSRFVTVSLLASLEYGEYAISARGFRNLRHLRGGGDTTFVYVAPPDMLPAGADTLPPSLDTLPPAADTLRLSPDTLPPGAGTPRRAPGRLRTPGKPGREAADST